MNGMKKPLLLALFLVALDLNIAAAAESEPPPSPEVTAAMKPYLDSYKLAGVVSLIADKGGKVHYKNLLGYADVEAKKPITEDNVFWIASMTKMFAGASIMMLADEGKVSLDDPVTKFAPQLEKWMVVEEKDPSHVLLKPLIRPVTVRHVLSHTSGLTGSSELQQITGSDSTPLKARALSSVTGPLQWQPGDKYAYGNQGMNIAARIVEIVSNMPYEEFLQKLLVRHVADDFHDASGDVHSLVAIRILIAGLPLERTGHGTKRSGFQWRTIRPSDLLELGTSGEATGMAQDVPHRHG